MTDGMIRIWEEALEIWRDGGWGMGAIAAISLVMFAMGIHIHLRLQDTGFKSVPEDMWRHWIDKPELRYGPIGALLDHATERTDVASVSQAFAQLRVTESTPFLRDLRVMRICVSAAPLMGLLGTVTGMLVTFSALSEGGGGDQTLGMVAAGISQALITTETGLVIALPGLFFHSQLKRGFEQYHAFLTHLETVSTQVLYKKQRQLERRRAQQLARRHVAQAVVQRLRDRLVVPAPAGNGHSAVDSGRKEGHHGPLS